MTQITLRPLFSLLVLLLSLCAFAVADAAMPDLAPRQDAGASTTTAAIAAAAPTGNPNSPLCVDYARVANLSTVALNITYRAAFMRSSPLGTFAARSIIDAEKPKLAGMMMDAQLNGACGNLSQAAIDGAAANLTAGFVLGLPIQEAVGIEVLSPVLPIISVAMILIMGGTFISL